MNFLTLILLLKINIFVFAVNQNPGHLKPFGSVGSFINVKELNQEFPTASKLFTYYIPKSKSILSRQVLNNNNHFSTWQTDEQLDNDVYDLSNTNIQVESFKSRRREKIEIKFGEFLHQCDKEPLLYAANVPNILQKYLVVPKPLQCETVLETFHSAILVINGINITPLMLSEDNDHFHCILRGNRRIVLVDTLKYPDVRKIVIPDRRQPPGPFLDPDRVDYDLFPALANVEYHIANLTSGDCLFIPNTWVFQERTFDKTISVIYNIKHHQALNIDVNELKTCSTYDETFTVDQIDWSPENHPQSFKDLITNIVNSKLGGFDQWQEKFSKHLSYDLSADPEASAIFEEFYGIIDVDGDGQITTNEVEQINGVHQHHITDILYEIVEIINNKRQTNTSKSVNSEDEQKIQSSENDDDIDEHLHLQDFKTDL